MGKIEKYVFKPNLQFFDGYVVKEKNEKGEIVKKELVDEIIEDEETKQKIHVKQRAEGLTIFTELESELEIFGIRTKEVSHLESTYRENTVLIYSEGEGYIYPKMRVCTVNDAINYLKLLEE